MIYLAVPLGYRMWQKSESKLELATDMVRQVMPEFQEKRNVILLCNNWYVKKNQITIVEEYPNPDLIGNARSDSVIYDLAPAPTNRKGKPAKHGRRLSIELEETLFSKYKNECVQEFRVALSKQIRQMVFYVTFVKTTETTIKSNVIVRALKHLIQQDGYHL